MKITAVRGRDPLEESRSFTIGRSYAADLDEALAEEHHCDSSCCDICHAREAGFPAVAADLLSGPTDAPLIAAVHRAHVFNATADPGRMYESLEWQAWFGYWDQAQEEGRLWQCPRCDAWNWDSDACGGCSASRPVWTLLHVAYCGMVTLRVNFEDRDAARTRAAVQLLDARADGYPVATRERGKEWEILEPCGSSLVPDACGFLSLELASP